MSIRIAVDEEENLFELGFEPNGLLSINRCCEFEVWRKGHDRVVKASQICPPCWDVLADLLVHEDTKMTLLRD